MGEKHFDSIGPDPSVNDGDKSVNILNVNKYDFMHNAYYSQGGFRDGTYLTAHTREMFYDTRRKISAYRNYVKPVVRSLVEPVFTEDAPRVILDEAGNEITVDTPYGIFLENVDNNGTPMQIAMESIMIDCRLYGMAVIVMDNFQNQPKSMQDVIDNRIMPYIYRKNPIDIETWEADDWGKLLSITLFDKLIPDKSGKELVRQYRKWSTTDSVLQVKDKNGDLQNSSTPVMHNLGVVPIIIPYVDKPQTVDNILSDPPLYDLARLNCVLYNKDSEIRDQERAQAFSNFYLQGDPNGNVTTGPHNVIFVPMDATISPGFASPDPGILSGLVENSEKLREAIFQIAEQNGVQGVKSAASGIAIQWNFYAVETQLKKTARIATDTEMAIKCMFDLYTGTEANYVVSYPSDFAPGDAKAVIDTYKVVLDMKPPSVMQSKIYEKIARLIFADEDPDELKQIIEDMEEELEGEDTEDTPPPQDIGMTGMYGEPMGYNE